MKAIFVEYESASGDSHSFPIASFGPNYEGGMELILQQLKDDSKDALVSFSIGEWSPPIHNPANIYAIQNQRESPKAARMIRESTKSKVSSYEKNKHIGNEPLW